MSLFIDTHNKSLSFSGVIDDRSLLHIRFIPENALSTEAVDVASVFLIDISLSKFFALFLLMGIPRLKSSLALFISISNILVFISIQLK